MDFINIGWGQKHKNYYLWNEEVLNCNACHKEIEKQFILNTLRNEIYKKIEQHPYCINCFERIKDFLEGTLTLVLIQEKPDDTIPVLPDTLISKQTKPANSIGGQILTDEDLKKEDLSKLNFSKCRLALKESFEGSKIGRNMTEELEYKDKPLTSVKDGLDLIRELAKAKPVIEYEEVKKLENKNEGE